MLKTIRIPSEDDFENSIIQAIRQYICRLILIYCLQILSIYDRIRTAI